jgi:hypothetical protein
MMNEVTGQHAPQYAAARYTAVIEPEAWVRNDCVPVDAPGQDRWDCTVFARANIGYLLGQAGRRGESLAGLVGVTDAEDRFQRDPAAPPWVAAWPGPFTIRVRLTRDA